jgi:hypothetical protein
MTKLLDQALEKAKKLPERDQDAIAAIILDELGDDSVWEQSFAASHDALAALANEALAEDRAGKTRPLDPEKL